MRLLSAVPMFVDINIGKKVTLNSRMYLKMSIFHKNRMKIFCDNNMCNIWFTSHIYIIRSGVRQFYIFISYQHRYIHFMRRFIPTKEKNVLHLVTLTRKNGITCINLSVNQSHLSAELLSLKVSFA